MARWFVFLRWAFLCLLATDMAGCASDESFTQLPPEPGRNLTLDTQQKPQQCVPYARDHSEVKLYGDAWTWWDQAAGKFPRGSQPAPGAVMVLIGYAGDRRGHVAVVRTIISPREIRVDHANWLDDGSIYLNDPVEDVSDGNDWSRVRVYNIKTGGWGGNIYPVQGFIGSNSDSVLDGRVAPRTDLKGSSNNDNAPDDRRGPSRKAPGTGPSADPLPSPDMVISTNIPRARQ